MNMLTIAQVTERTTLSRRTIYNYMDKDQFPKQMRLGERQVRWIEEEVTAWLRARADERGARRKEVAA